MCRCLGVWLREGVADGIREGVCSVWGVLHIVHEG